MKTYDNHYVGVKSHKEKKAERPTPYKSIPLVFLDWVATLKNYRAGISTLHDKSIAILHKGKDNRAKYSAFRGIRRGDDDVSMDDYSRLTEEDRILLDVARFQMWLHGRVGKKYKKQMLEIMQRLDKEIESIQEIYNAWLPTVRNQDPTYNDERFMESIIANSKKRTKSISIRHGPRDYTLSRFFRKHYNDELDFLKRLEEFVPDAGTFFESPFYQEAMNGIMKIYDYSLKCDRKLSRNITRFDKTLSTFAHQMGTSNVKNILSGAPDEYAIPFPSDRHRTSLIELREMKKALEEVNIPSEEIEDFRQNFHALMNEHNVSDIIAHIESGYFKFGRIPREESQFKLEWTNVFINYLKKCIEFKHFVHSQEDKIKNLAKQMSVWRRSND